MRPADPDDIDSRFEALVAQFDEDEIVRLAAEANRRPRRTARGIAPIVVITLAGLVVVVGLIISLRPDVLDKLGSLGSLGAGEPTPRPAMGPAFARPGPALTQIAEDGEGSLGIGGLDPAAAGPFAGSRAVGYANGEKGLVMPSARALGGLTRKEVEDALGRVRGLLAAGHLDPDTVRGKNPAAFIKLLHPGQRKWFTRQLDKGEKSTTRWWVFSLKPGTAELTSDVIKVDGETTFSRRRHADGRKGITIKVDYLFVYAVNRPGDREATTRLVEHYTGEISAYRQNGEVAVWLEKVSVGTSGTSCDFHDGFAHPYFDGAAQKVQPSGKPIDPYDRRTDESRNTGCRLTTGT